MLCFLMFLLFSQFNCNYEQNTHIHNLHFIKDNIDSTFTYKADENCLDQSIKYVDVTMLYNSTQT